MNWEFWGAHPWLAFSAIVAAYCAFAMAIKLGSRILRTLNIAVRGWPPAHLDADGDWKPEPEYEGNE